MWAVTHPLVGTWSSNNTGFSYTSNEDVSITLNDGGYGQVEYSRIGGYREITQLTWQVPGEGVLELSYRDGPTTPDGAPLLGEAGGAPTRVSYRIAEEDTHFNGRIPILRIDPPIMMHDEFGPKYFSSRRR